MGECQILVCSKTRLQGSNLYNQQTSVTPINTALPRSDLTEDVPAIYDAVNSFIDHLQASVRRRVENIPDLAPG